MATATMWTKRSAMLARAEAKLQSDYRGWRAESPSSWPEPVVAYRRATALQR
jgi:hypothetical protein